MAEPRPESPSDDGGGRKPLTATFWGVRGSTPVSGADYLTFGGCTMCIEFQAGQRRLVLDAGSGIRKLGQRLGEEGILDVDIVLSHFHMDHVLGLLNFAPLFRRGASVTIHAPTLEMGRPEDHLSRLFAKPYFPVTPGDMGATFAVRSFRPGDSLQIAGFEVGTIGLSHPGGSCGYRIAHSGRSVAVIGDYEHASDEPDKALADFCEGADLLLYDAQWDEADDYGQRRGWGHSSWQAGCRLLDAARAARMGCIHHAPDASDRVLAMREADLQRRHAASFFAREGETLALDTL